MHKTLRRQLDGLGLDFNEPPSRDGWKKMVRMVDRAYKGQDQDRYLAERALEISSKEMLEVYEELRRSSTNVVYSILQNTPAVISIKDSEGRYILANKRFCEVFEVEQKDITGRTPHDLFPEEVATQHLQNDQAVLESGQPLEIEESAPSIDGSHTYLTVKFPIDDMVEGETLVCGISTDITHRLRAEEQLRHVQKMDALGKLTGGIAHDFNNMLAIVLGYADLLDMDAGEDTEASEFISEIRHAAERGMKLTKNLLGFSKGRKMEASAVSVAGLISNSRSMLSKTLTPMIHLDMDLPEITWRVWLDADELEDALLNMSINAMHAMPGGGTLTLTVKNDILDQVQAQDLSLEAGEYVCFSVTDTGIGMDAETKTKIFDPFFTTKGENGTGLGMSQVYGFLSRASGAAAVESIVDEGTTVTLYFPRHVGKESRKKQIETSNVVSITGSERILVVDDEPALRSLTRIILTSHGYDVICARDGINALQVLESESIDLVISDVIMPGMNGDQLATEIRERFPNVSIQLASGYTEDLNREIDNQSLFASVLTKPFNSRTLLTRVREILDQRKQ